MMEVADMLEMIKEVANELKVICALKAKVNKDMTQVEVFLMKKVADVLMMILEVVAMIKMIPEVEDMAKMIQEGIHVSMTSLEEVDMFMTVQKEVNM